MIEVEIDPNSGFCFGVVKAVEAAEKALQSTEPLVCLGDIVHNHQEVSRLESKGMETLSLNDLDASSSKQVLIRAHGEPPSTYEFIKKHHHKLIDATCPVVLKLQQRIKESFSYLCTLNGQVLIYGKKNHAEVIGLVGQTDNKAIVIESFNDIHKIDLTKPTHLYAQTTKSIDEFKKIATFIKSNINPNVEYKSFDTICRQVSNRWNKIAGFAQKHELIVFVGGAKSSNAKMLFEKCFQTNSRSFFVLGEEEVDKAWFEPMPKSVGVCGATSTPPWLMQKVAQRIEKITDN